MWKKGECIGIGQQGFLHEDVRGGGHLKCLKRGCNRKERRRNKDLKKKRQPEIIYKIFETNSSLHVK